MALALFCVAFALMLFATLRLSRNATDRFASIPLSDQVETHAMSDENNDR